MSIYPVPEAEELLECPYDKAHMIRVKRFQYHLMKCRQNHLTKDYAICPFNAKHEMPKPELRYHMANCPFRATIEREIEYDETRRSNGLKLSLKGCTDVPPYNAAEIESDENWDAEIPLHTRMGVDPTFFENLQYRDMSGMSRSARKEYYQKLQTKGDETGEEPKNEVNTSLRIPSNMSRATILYQKTSKPPSLDVFTYSLSMAGIGRGRGLPQIGLVEGREMRPVRHGQLVDELMERLKVLTEQSGGRPGKSTSGNIPLNTGVKKEKTD